MSKNIVLLSIEKVQSVTGLSRTTIYELSKKSGFPKQVTITRGRVGWVESEVEAWIAAKIADRDGKAA